MPRIEIELTSARPDGTWTWRAAGAKQPRGTLDAGVLPGGAKVGDVLRAEADIDIDGITVRSAVASTPKKGAAPERIEIIGSGRDEPPVTTNMRGGVEAGGQDRGRRGDRDAGGRGGPGGRGPGGPGRPGGGGGGPGGPGGRRPDGASRAPSTVDRGERARREAASRPGADGRPGRDRPGRDRPAGDRPARPTGDRPTGDRPTGDRLAGDRPVGDRPERPAGDRPAGDRPPRPTGDRPSRPAGERSGAGRPAGDRPPGDRPRRDRPAGERGERPARSAPRAPEVPKPKAKRLQPGRVYRDAVLAELSPERKAVAEQILRGGIPAVRQAVEEQNAKAREEGGPEIKADALLAMAEELLPALKAAEWRDRAEAAVDIVDEISVRDLRSVVIGADTARDEEGRALAAQLREALDRRAAAERQTWVDEITSSLDEGRIVRALRISGRPPEPGVRFPADLAKRLSDASGDALAPDTTADRWAAVLEAVVASPVRRTITPKGLPAEPGEALTRSLHLAAPRIPALAALMGITPGAPPRRPTRPGTPSGGPGGASTGPRPARPATAPGAPGRPAGRPTVPPPGRPTPTPPPSPATAAVAPTETPESPTAPEPASEPAASEPAAADPGASAHVASEPLAPAPSSAVPADTRTDVTTPPAEPWQPPVEPMQPPAPTVEAPGPDTEPMIDVPPSLADTPATAGMIAGGYSTPAAGDATVEPDPSPAAAGADGRPSSPEPLDDMPGSVSVAAGDSLGDDTDAPA